MATLKYTYDNSDVETGGGGEQAPIGTLDGTIVAITYRDTKKDGSAANDIEVVVDVGAEYSRLWRYIGFAANQRWKMREFTDAVGLPASGTLTDAILKKKVGAKVLVKTVQGSSMDGSDRTEIKTLFPPRAEGDSTAGLDSGGGDEGFDSWSDDDLKAQLKESDVAIAGRFTRDKAIAALVGVEDEDGTVEDDGDPDGEVAGFDISQVEGFEDFDTWDSYDLKGEMDNRDLAIAGKFTDAKARVAIIEAVEAEFESGDGDAVAGSAAAEDDYEDWELSELKEEVDSRKEQGAEITITGRATPGKLIAALREDDVKPF